MGMNVNAVNIYGGSGVAGPSNYTSTAKYVPSDKERQEKLSRIEERANGGTSKDGDTVTVSAEGSKLQKLYESNGKSAVDFLKEDTGSRNSVPETIAANSEKMGISKERNEIKARSAEIDAFNRNMEDVRTEASAKSNEANLTQYSAHELKEMYEEGDITTAAYKDEMESRATNRAGDKEVKQETPPVKPDTDKEPKENINTVNNNVNAEKERLQRIQEKNAEEAKREERERLNEEDTDKAQERRAEATEKRLDNERENLEADRKADKELYNVAFSFQDSPYDVTSSIKEMEEDDSEIGVNRIEIPERNTPESTMTATVRAAEAAEETAELEDIRSTVNSENAEAANNMQNIAEAGNAAAQTTIDENAVNSRFTVQEVA